MLKDIIAKGVEKRVFDNDRRYLELFYLTGETEIKKLIAEVSQEISKAIEDVGKGTESDRLILCTTTIIQTIDRCMAESYNQGRTDQEDAVVAQSVV